MNKVSVSIIIVNWNSINYLKKCIKSVRRHAKEYSYEIVVIDNDSAAKEQSQIAELKDVKVVLNEENKGFAAANNQGFRIAVGKYLLMLNPDTEILRRTIDKLVAYLENNPSVYGVGPRLYHSNKFDYQPSAFRFQTPFTVLLSHLPFMRIFKNIYIRILYRKNRTRKVDFLCGAAILFRREVIERIGFLDETYFMYAEEQDFCKRMALARLPLNYYPEAEVIHYGGRSQIKNISKRDKYYWASELHYFRKYYSPLSVEVSINLLILLLRVKNILLKNKVIENTIRIIRETQKMVCVMR